MKIRITLAIIAVAFAVVYFPHLYSSEKRITIHPLEAGPFWQEAANEDAMDKAIAQEVERTKDPATGQVPKERLIMAAQIQQQLFQAQKTTQRFGALAPVPGITWSERGPSNVGGRTRALLYDANDSNHLKVWAGGVGGGLWFTNNIEDITPTWNSINDFFANLAITSIAQDPTNPLVMYFATGEGWFNADGIRGLGIYKSADGGLSWAPLPATQGNPLFYFIQKMVVSPTGAILAATRDGGIQRSADGGGTWTQVAGSGIGVGNSNRGADIVIGQDGKIYASTGIFNSGGIFRSDDDGLTFNTIYASTPDESRIVLAVAPSDMNVVYALVQSGYGIKKIIKTSNAGDLLPAVAWATLANPSWCDNGSPSGDFTRGQAWYDLVAAVNPFDANDVLIGGVDLFHSSDGGMTWAQVTQWATRCAGLPYVHADNHTLLYKPVAAPPATEIVIGNDGGVFLTMDAATTFTAVNTNYNVSQFYSTALHPTDPNYALAGSQDNGTQKFTLAGINATTAATGGDGGYCHIDQNNPNIQITSYTGNNLNVSTDGGTTFRFYGFAGGSFINATVYDDSTKVFYGGYSYGSVFRWTSPATGGPAVSINIPDFSSGLVTYAGISPLTANRVYFGLSNGAVVRIDAANTSLPTSKVIKPVGGSISVSGIAIDPVNEDHVLITYSNYGVTHVYESRNATSITPAWIASDGNLPDMPVRWAMFDPRNSNWALIATELGVWSTDSISGASTNWQPTNNGFANVSVDMLKYRSSDRTLAAATHGRGLFTTVIPAATVSPLVLNNNIAGITGRGPVTNSGGYRLLNNPFRDYIDVRLPAGAPAGQSAVRLLDLNGRLVHRAVNRTNNGRLHIDLSAVKLTRGVYVLEIQTGREYYSQQVFKE